MTTIPGLIPGTKFSFQVQKPKVVRMHSFLDLEEFQTTTKLYGQTIDWPEWFCSPRIGSEQCFKFVDEGVIDPEEVRRAGVILPSRPKNVSTIDEPGNSTPCRRTATQTFKPSSRKLRQRKLTFLKKPVDEEEVVGIFLQGLHPVFQPRAAADGTRLRLCAASLPPLL